MDLETTSGSRPSPRAARCGEAAQVVGERFKSDLVSSLVDAVGIGDRPRYGRSVAYVADLRPVPLVSALGHGDPVGEVGDVGRLRFACGRGTLQQREHLALEVELTVGVLSQEPGSVGCLLPDERGSWPAMFADDLAEAVGVADVDAAMFHRLFDAEEGDVHTVR